MPLADARTGLSLQLCGGLSLRDGERQRVPLPRKAAALLAYLAVEPGPHSRAHLATLLWADSDEAHAAMSLRQALSKLRDVCGEALRSDRTMVSLQREPFASACRCDVLQFLALHERQPREACETDVHRFLEDVTAEDAPEFLHWGDRTRARLVRLAQASLARAVQEATARRDYASALAAAERWLDIVPESVDAACQAIDAAVLLHDDARVHTLGDQALRRLAEEGRATDTEGDRIRNAMQRLRAVRWVTPVHGAVAVPAAGTAKVQVDPPRSLLASLCERDVPWTTLGAAFDDVTQSGRASGVTLEGRLGAGRTRLLQDVAAMCAMRGATVIAAASPPHAPVMPYGAAAALIQQMVDLAALGGVHETHLQTLRTLVPALEERFPALRRSAMALPPSDATFSIRLQEALAQALFAICEDTVAVVALDDAMWYDRESANVLQAVAMRTTEAPILWLLTGADDLGQERNNPAWADFARSSRRVELAPLSIEGVERMLVELSRVPSGWRAVAECIHHGSHGVPGYVQASLQLMQQRWGAISTEWQTHSLAAPCIAPLAARAQQHVESLDDVARTVLLSLALDMEQGHPVPLAEWRARPAVSLDRLSHLHGISRLRAGVLGQRLVELGLAMEQDGGFRCASPVLVEYLRQSGSPLVRDELRRVLAMTHPEAVGT
ncbi:AAA family ATPase [Gemmatimonas phototrophica]|uniref:Orc1-like AAA ATPase domain-containing protein n=1 Tax=Gemmatimonas phototrophica TaxID=1379270 RepID=A0A143BJT5_9BACT|nr:AAA family ATPase [Gemmatimonas phototrophica]AMW05289.1 hypothetical protein GEMMAAP_11720 [Gemmatimonas phototrophica]